MDAKSIVGGIAGYFTFSIKLVVSPTSALSEYRAHGKVAQPLVGTLVAGIGVAFVLVQFVNPQVFANDTSWVVTLVRRLGKMWTPVAAVILVIVAAVLFHAIARAFLWIHRGASGGQPTLRGRLGGSIFDSVNAALAVAAVLLPLGCAAVVIFALVGSVTERIPLILWLIAVVPALFLVAYFPRCLAVTHPDTEWLQAFVTMCFVFVGIYYGIALLRLLVV